MKTTIYLILILILSTSLPLGAQYKDYSQNPFPNEMLSGYNSEKEHFNLPDPSFNFKGSGQINQPVILRGDGFLDIDDDGDPLKVPAGDGVWIILSVLAVYSGVVYSRKRKKTFQP